MQKDPYMLQMNEALNKFHYDLLNHLELTPTLDPYIGDSVLKYLLDLACQSQNERNITLGRKALQEIPRNWVLNNIERNAEHLLQLNNEWEFRRLLELYSLLDKTILSKLINRGINNPNAVIREVCADFAKKS